MIFYESYLDGYIYASSTDFFSYGTINIYDQNNNFVKSFNTSITPGKIIFDTRNTSVSINEINPLIGKENTIYDLNGKQINSIKNTTNGVYILNGKKVFIKR